MGRLFCFFLLVQFGLWMLVFALTSEVLRLLLPVEVPFNTVVLWLLWAQGMLLIARLTTDAYKKKKFVEALLDHCRQREVKQPCQGNDL